MTYDLQYCLAFQLRRFDPKKFLFRKHFNYQQHFNYQPP